MITDEMSGNVIKCAYKVHNTLGAGFLEKVYENALAIELRKNGFEVAQQINIPVFYNEIQVGDYYADLLVNNKLIIEVKAIENLQAKHEVQLVNYLAGTNLDIGLLIDFGSSVKVKRKYRVYQKGKD